MQWGNVFPSSGNGTVYNLLFSNSDYTLCTGIAQGSDNPASIWVRIDNKNQNNFTYQCGYTSNYGWGWLDYKFCWIAIGY